MSFSLGVDTGGTYTDAALLDQKSGRVVSLTKALTTYEDLSKGVGQALKGIFDGSHAPHPSRVTLVGLSTTLATNAILEGVGGRASLFLIGYDPHILSSFDLVKDLAATDIVHISGGHDHRGDEAVSLDEAAIRDAARRRFGYVDAIGVSSYFSVKNPVHELRAKRIIQEETGLAVACGHELTGRLNSVRRAATVALNARLVPMIGDLIAKVECALEELGIPGNLMVVRGDGSLVTAQWAGRRPIETVLSGPAASIVGAWHLAEQGPKRMWVVDMGGTSTDVAHMEDGLPKLNLEGATVGRWRTMVTAVDVKTRGLGGDSSVIYTPERHLKIGPRRAIPLCRLASSHPRILKTLEEQAGQRRPSNKHGTFLVALGPLDRYAAQWEASLMERLGQGPLSLSQWEAGHRRANGIAPKLDGLINRRLVGFAGFTPTDALHAAGLLRIWDNEASRMGATLLARVAGWDPDRLVRWAIEEVGRLIGLEIVGKALSDEGVAPDWEKEPMGTRLLDKALGKEPGKALSCRLLLQDAVAGIGAPTHAYLPQAVEMLGGKMVPVPHAEVANAVGAVAGGVVIRRKVEIRPHQEKPKVVLHLPEEKRVERNMEIGIAEIRRFMETWLTHACREAGGGKPEIRVKRVDLDTPLSPGSNERMLIASEFYFTAVGRPKRSDDACQSRG